MLCQRKWLWFLFLFSNVESMPWEQAGRGCLLEERRVRKLFGGEAKRQRYQQTQSSWQCAMFSWAEGLALLRDLVFAQLWLLLERVIQCLFQRELSDQSRSAFPMEFSGALLCAFAFSVDKWADSCETVDLSKIQWDINPLLRVLCWNKFKAIPLFPVVS